MAVISTQTHPKLLWPGIMRLYGDHFYKYQEDEWKQVFTEKNSEKAFEETLQLTGFGLAPEKPQGGAVSYDTEQQGFLKRFVHVPYGLGYVLTHEEIKDNLYDELARRRAPALARSMRETISTVNWNHFNRATDSTYQGADGKELLATDHPNVTGGTQANEPSSGVDLSEVAIEDEVIRMRKTTNDRGLYIKIKPRMLIVAPDEWFNAQRILKSNLQSGTANNDINVIRSQGILPDGIVSVPYLTDTDAWFIRTDVDGLCHIWRERPMFTRDNEFNTDNELHKAYMRFSSGWDDWRSVFGSDGA